MWIRHKESYYNLGAVIAVHADRSQHGLRLFTIDGDEQFLNLPKKISFEDVHCRLTALLAPCEPFALDPPCGKDRAGEG